MDTEQTYASELAMIANLVVEPLKRENKLPRIGVLYRLFVGVERLFVYWTVLTFFQLCQRYSSTGKNSPTPTSGLQHDCRRILMWKAFVKRSIAPV